MDSVGEGGKIWENGIEKKKKETTYRPVVVAYRFSCSVARGIFLNQ